VTQELFNEVGAALYGPRWQAGDFADDLGVSVRNVRRWMAGTAPIPEGVVSEIYLLCFNAHAELAGLVEKIGAMVQHHPE
jgi:hypothetical protein